jgi:hypothetical protein
MKVHPPTQLHRHRSPGGLQQSTTTRGQASELIEGRDIGSHFSVWLWLASHRIAQAGEETPSAARSISSSIRRFSPALGRWAFLTRKEKSCASWAGLSRAPITDRARSGN